MAKPLNEGQVIRGYRLTTAGTNNGAGTALWCFARKGSREFFLKQFLSPVYPLDSHPGTPAGKARRRAECERFEQRTNRVTAVLGAGGDGGFLIRTVDFFRDDGHYFKVTERVNPADRHVERLSAGEQHLALLTVAYSLRMLHQRSNLVHSDIKPDNIILESHGKGLVAKLIDFDGSFFEDDLPDPVEMVGDQLYHAPETVSYVLGGPARLTQKVDVFAAGLVFVRYLSGALPELPRGHHYASEALLDGATLRIPPPRQLEMRRVLPLVERMLAADPEARPTMAEVHEEMRGLFTPHVTVPPPPLWVPPPPEPGGSRVKSTGFGVKIMAGGAAVPPSPPPSPKPAGEASAARAAEPVEPGVSRIRRRGFGG